MDFMHADEDMINNLANTNAPMHGSHDGHDVPNSSSHDGHSMSGHDGHLMSGHSMSGHSMSMAFHAGYQETILFSFWTISTVGGLVGSMIGIFLAAMLYEGLKVFREYLLQHTLACEKNELAASRIQSAARLYSANNSNGLREPLASENGDSPNGMAGNTGTNAKLLRPHPFSVPHLVQSFLHMLQVFISYLLMLVFMTYNVWLALAVVLGAGVGYFLFGWRKRTIVDINEHCH